jgi:hypothetical protein
MPRRHVLFWTPRSKLVFSALRECVTGALVSHVLVLDFN